MDPANKHKAIRWAAYHVLQPRVRLQTKHKTLVCHYFTSRQQKRLMANVMFYCFFLLLGSFDLIWHLTQFWKVKSYYLINWRQGLFLKSHTILYFWLCIQDRRKQFYYTKVFFSSSRVASPTWEGRRGSGRPAPPPDPPGCSCWTAGAARGRRGTARPAETPPAHWWPQHSQN